MSIPARALAVFLALASVASAASIDLPELGCGVPPGAERCARWTSAYAPEGAVAAGGSAIATSPDGAIVYVAGDVGDAQTARDFVVAALDASSGATRWVVRRDAGGNDAATHLAVSPDGARVFAAGRSDGAGPDFLALALDATTGSVLWEAREDGARHGEDVVSGLAVSSDGTKVFVSGWSDTDNGVAYNLDALAVAYDAATGARLWSTLYDGPARFWDVPYGLAAGNVPGVGETVFFPSRTNVGMANEQTDLVVVALDAATGAIRWTRAYDGPAHSREYPYAIALDASGATLAVVGESAGLGTALDYVTLSLDAATGAIRWAARQDGARADDRPLGVAFDEEGRVFATGFSVDGPTAAQRSVMTVAYAADGSRLWIARHGSPAGEAGTAVAAADGKVVVAGLRGGLAFGVGVGAGGAGTAVSGFLTLAYAAADGAPAWSATHADEGPARAVALSPDASVAYVAGGDNALVALAYDA